MIGTKFCHINNSHMIYTIAEGDAPNHVFVCWDGIDGKHRTIYARKEIESNFKRGAWIEIPDPKLLCNSPWISGDQDGDTGDIDIQG